MIRPCLSAVWLTSVFVRECKYHGRGLMGVARNSLSTCIQPASFLFERSQTQLFHIKSLCTNQHANPSCPTQQTYSSPPTTSSQSWLCFSTFSQPPLIVMTPPVVISLILPTRRCWYRFPTVRRPSNHIILWEFRASAYCLRGNFRRWCRQCSGQLYVRQL